MRKNIWPKFFWWNFKQTSGEGEGLWGKKHLKLKLVSKDKILEDCTYQRKVTDPMYVAVSCECIMLEKIDCFLYHKNRGLFSIWFKSKTEI